MKNLVIKHVYWNVIPIKYKLTLSLNIKDKFIQIPNQTSLKHKQTVTVRGLESQIFIKKHFFASNIYNPLKKV